VRAVLLDVWLELPQCARHETHGAVRVRACPTPGKDVEMPAERALSGHVTADQLVEVGGQRGQAEQAGTALPDRSGSKPVRDPRGFAERTGVAGEDAD
jgi:hypothetical protein